MERSWASWAQWKMLLFVLACSFFVPLILWALKLAYKFWKRRTHSRRAAERRRRLGPIHVIPSTNLDEENAIPLSSYAIERVGEVNGISISQPTAPFPNPNPSRPSPLPNQHAERFLIEISSTADHLQSPSTISLTSVHPAMQLTPQSTLGSSTEHLLPRPPKALLSGNSHDPPQQRTQGDRKSRRLGFRQEEPERSAGLIATPSETRSEPCISDDSQQTGGSVADSEMHREQSDLRTKPAPYTLPILPNPLGSHPVTSADLEFLETLRRTNTKEPGSSFSVNPQQTTSETDPILQANYEFESGFQFPGRIRDAHRAASLQLAEPLIEGTNDQSTTTQAVTKGETSKSPKKLQKKRPGFDA